MTRLPESLPEKVFLLAVDHGRQRLTQRDELNLVLRAAVLADLVLRGHLRNEAGKAVPAGPAWHLDPLPQGVLDEITESRPRSWRRWIDRDRRIVQVMANRLADAGVLELGRARVLGLFPTMKITLLAPEDARRLVSDVQDAVLGDQPESRVDPGVAALAALAAAAGLRTVLNGRTRRRFKARIAALGEAIEPIPAALRRAVAARGAS
ncbi:MAG TPA: GPP34 family phosphoprotein [Amycolatopsis sp.]|uniref:GOLPH3/VPS74 family protein n=1 Tax=Amycolatopsis sp. TaxID=37632 RepID=UPI002B4A8645|nr:GPP34 family phosphoprotein [Amycolatopsis sp.]HKS49192.1 GPP34 family phosphoprotein [Amycolatopsis sp.]